MSTPHDVANGDWPKLIAALTNPKSQNPQQRKTGPQLLPSTSMNAFKPTDRRETYLINPPNSVSILSAREEVPSAHHVEVESRAPDIEINAKDYERNTPLILAARGGHEAVVQLLIGREDIEINTKDDEEYTPLILTARWGKEAVVQLLIGRDNIEINAKNMW